MEQGVTMGVVAVAAATPHFWFIIARGDTATLEISGYVMKRIFIFQKTLFYKTFAIKLFFPYKDNENFQKYMVKNGIEI